LLLPLAIAFGVAFPAAIAAIADVGRMGRGVGRVTVYNHFPDMTSLIRACTEHGMAVTRPPLAAPWAAIEDPTLRLRTGLAELYPYYRANARLLGNVTRDLPLVGTGGSEAFLERMGELFSALAAGWPGDAGTQRLRMAAIGHAMAFETWRSLTQPGLSDAEAADLMAEVFPGVPVRDGVDGHDTLLGIDKARRMLGYAPGFSWRELF